MPPWECSSGGVCLGSSLSLVVTGVLLGATAWREAMLAVHGVACLAPVIALCLFTRPRTISTSRRKMELPDLSVLKARQSCW